MIKNIAVFLLLLIPPISKVLYPSSMHLGFSFLAITIISCSLIFGIKLNKKLNYYLLLFISIDLTLKIINNSYYEKLVYHYILLVLMFNASFCLYKLVEDNFIDVRKTCNYIIAGLLIVGLLGYFNFNPLDKGGRPIFIFDEPSHYVIYLSPFFLFYMLYRENKIYKILIFISVYLIIGLIIKSLLALILCAIFLFLIFFYEKKIFLIYATLATLIFLGFKYFDSGQVNYYISERIPSIHLNNQQHINNNIPTQESSDQHINIDRRGYFNKVMDSAIVDSYNGSLLVMLSGYQRAYAVISSGNYFGLGFNNLGRIGPKLSAMEKIERVYGGPLNILDGGSLSPKLIAEFGILGLIFLFFYLRKYIDIIKASIKNYGTHGGYINNFFSSVYLSSAIIFFFRYTSFFSVECLLLISSFFYFNNIKKQ